MKVLVTGGCGFLGFHVCTHFREQGAEVVAYDSLAKHEFARNPYMRPEARDYNHRALAASGVQVVVEDIRNKEALVEYTSDCDYICHTAAQPAMTISWEDPELDFTTNTRGTFNVLEAARIHQLPVAICSSIHTFGPDRINASLTEAETRYERSPVTIDEEEPLLQGTITPLHASKRSNEIYLQAYVDTFKLKAACFRLTGIYGPNQFGGEDHGWVANFAIRAMLGLPLTIFGTGKQLRDILFASDAAAAFGAFYRQPVPGIYNLGGGPANMISLIECIDLIEEILEQKAEVSLKEGRFGDLRYFVTNYDKFANATGWQPQVRPEQGVTQLIGWLQQNPDLFARQPALTPAG
ncbi:MAG: NAD-dependent epimerase/dehydratase family protein [Caldilineaceae bacterium]|nr:NAD-dependent epimerase/dehydratase family protein [Caldilineaceae bacterium]